MTDDDREMGVDFGDLSGKLASHDYPADTGELVDAYGDEQLTFSDGEATFRELVEPMGNQEFDDEQDVRQALLTMVDDEAIGRKNYSDRTPPAPGEDRQAEGAPGQDVSDDQQSF
ncbi:DUF5789 family protein [Halostella salina]|uniref:DUF5789 family protein n=1 Tax=Halostella salina TaxID=1547897 RepID=UPI000EF7A807|nr:hypothetical protein [Halostella salina]